MQTLMTKTMKTMNATRPRRSILTAVSNLLICCRGGHNRFPKSQWPRSGLSGKEDALMKALGRR